MYRATFIFEGRSIFNMEEEDLSDFPKKGEKFTIDGKPYLIKKFSLIGMTIIYVLG